MPDEPDPGAAVHDLGPITYRPMTVDEARDYQPLHDFSCGTQATLQGDDLRAANEVHQALDSLYKGKAAAQTTILGERADGSLVAVCCVQEKPIEFPPLMSINVIEPEGPGIPEGFQFQFEPASLGLPILEGTGAYIAAIGCQEGYGGRGAGSAMLQNVVDNAIPALWAERDRPYIHAKVLPGNDKSKRMFAAVGFLNLGRSLGTFQAREQDTHLLAVSGPFTLR